MQQIADFYEMSCCTSVLRNSLKINKLRAMRQKVRAKMQQKYLFLGPFYP